MSYHAQQILHINSEINKTTQRDTRKRVIDITFLLDDIGFNKGLLLARQDDYAPHEIVKILNYYNRLQCKCRRILCKAVNE